MVTTLIQVGKKFKVYQELGGKNRKLLGVFKSSDEAIRFMNGVG
jgi:hypothetical protein